MDEINMQQIVATRSAKTFEELHVFKQARSVIHEIYRFTQVGPCSKDLAFVNQIRRSALSIVSNIAEGFERGSDIEFARFLFIARGSCGEMRAQLLIALDQNYLGKEQHDALAAKAKEIGTGLTRLAAYLKSTARKNGRLPSRTANSSTQ